MRKLLQRRIYQMENIGIFLIMRESKIVELEEERQSGI